MGQPQQRNDRNRSSLKIEFMSPPSIKVKGARQLPTPAPMHNQNVNKGRSRIGAKKFRNVTALLGNEPAPKPAQSGYNSPASSTTSSVPEKDSTKLSKSQRAKLRKRKKEAQKYFNCSPFFVVYGSFGACVFVCF